MKTLTENEQYDLAVDEVMKTFWFMTETLFAPEVAERLIVRLQDDIEEFYENFGVDDE